MHIRTWLAGASLAAAVTVTPDTLGFGDAQFGPSQEMARRRGPEIFNAVHNAMRQWGSSLHHNGMSYFIATVPKGVLLHHGNSSPNSPYTYETTRDLKFLYVDGMGGGKTSMGTLDSQDYLLRGKNPANETERWARKQREHAEMDDEPPPPKRRGPGGGGPMDEQARAKDLCALCKEWGLQGIVRMEAGFEIIKCDFSDGLQEVQALQRPDQTNGPGVFGNLEFIRGLSERYQGIGSTRTIIDYSSMVSAFFFPVNLTNPNPKRQDLPRLFSVEESQLAAIKDYLEDVISDRRDESARTIDWQDVTDLIVGRYADRIKYMAESVSSIKAMASEVNFLLTLFVDGSGSETTETSINRCTNFYLRSLTPTTESDHFIKTALQTVTHEICSTLFRVRGLVVEDPAPDQESLAASTSALRALMQSLNWARFKRCPPCGIDEVCVIPMWPMGTVEEYNNPRCSNGSEMRDGERYWDGGPGRGRRPGKGGPGGSPPPPEF